MEDKNQQKRYLKDLGQALNKNKIRITIGKEETKYGSFSHI